MNRKKIKKIGEIEKVGLRELKYERQIFWSNEDHKWFDCAEIIVPLKK